MYCDLVGLIIDVSVQYPDKPWLVEALQSLEEPIRRTPGYIYLLLSSRQNKRTTILESPKVLLFKSRYSLQRR